MLGRSQLCNLPGGLDGLGVLTALRAARIEAPVLILSALSAVDERVSGLRAGGDDYMTKPFDFLELNRSGFAGGCVV